MNGSHRKPVSKTVSVSSVRFLRDVTASVLATGLATMAFSGVSHRTTVEPARPGFEGKSQDRMAPPSGAVPGEANRILSSLALFGVIPPEPVAWSNIPAPATSRISAAPAKVHGAPVLPQLARADVIAAAPSSVALPPKRPSSLVVADAAPTAMPAPAVQEPASKDSRSTAWRLPGVDLLPSRADLVHVVAFVPDLIASTGHAAASYIGLP